MKVVICSDGPFQIPDKWAKTLVVSSEYEIPRTDPWLVRLVEQFPKENPDLRVLEIPDEATDHCVIDHDGFEEVIFVVDGKLKRIAPDYESFQEIDCEHEFTR